MADLHSGVNLARMELWRFLSACYYEPCAEFSEERLFDSIVGMAKQVDEKLAVRAMELRDAFAGDDLETLLVDYTRLFLGPMQVLASPYESSWVGSPSASPEDPEPDVAGLYAQAGFEIDPNVRERPDHIAIELEFLYALCFGIVSAQSPAVQANTVTLRKTLLTEHLASWLPRFDAAVQAAAQSKFYRALSMFTEELLAAEMASLSTT